MLLRYLKKIFYNSVAELRTIWYWFEEYGECIDKILIAFYEKRLNKEYWEGMQSWQYFDTHNAIAYRGGQGYVYTIYPLRIAS